ncbi:glycosyltransferase [Candidatus Woesearchaeota archaeon]|nr:glycosyltransferase [Candidatus Woesearchaeota archaeon]
MTPHELTLFLYNLTLMPIIFFSILFIFLSFANLFIYKEGKRYKKLKELPFISVQIPAYNDPVADRCVNQCLGFDYPKEKYEIIIVDDSTNAKTRQALKRHAAENPSLVKYLHRNNRENFKAGALQNAMKISKGDIIVIFDADWIPEKDFLKKIVRPFSDPKVAIVQAGQGFYNKDKNLITRFGAYLLTIYHSIIMPINNRIGCVFFCGTAGAIRRSAFLEAGGWNAESLTEDSDLTINLLLKGWDSVYLDFETQSEVPETFEGFIKQQMRWCYGNARAFFDNAFSILFGKKLSFGRKMMVAYLTLGNIVAPVVVLMTMFGLAGWFIGDLNLFTISDFITLLSRLFFTSGFLLIGMLALYRKGQLSEFPYLLLSSVTLGIVLAAANSMAFFRAVINSKPRWFCTPKAANYGIIENGNS